MGPVHLLELFREVNIVGKEDPRGRDNILIGGSMAEKLNDKEIVSFEELLMANMYQLDALTQLLVEKGIIREDEFLLKLKQVQLEYERKRKGKVQ
jgi:hypothetical protein